MKFLFLLLFIICTCFSLASATPCDYVVGDVNGSGSVNSLDVTYLYSYLMGMGSEPPFDCGCPPWGTGTWFVACDVNGSCTVNIVDVLYLVNYFRGGPAPVPCPDCPPTPSLLTPSPENITLTDDTVKVWFGNIDGSPIEVDIGTQMPIDVFIQTTSEVYAGGLSFTLGADSQYVTGFLSETLGSFSGVLTEWDDVTFIPVQGSPPNPDGWFAQSFSAIYELSSPFISPPLHYEDPTLIATFVIEIANDSSLLGQTVDFLAPGYNDRLGYDLVGDTTAIIEFIPVYSIPSFHFPPGSGLCNYITGDVNMVGGYNQIDVTFGVNFFKEGSPVPPYICDCPPHGSWFVAGDVNASCSYNGLDITYNVNWFKNQTNPPIPCADCLPGRANLEVQKN